jgi:hypothetical protein
VNKDVTDGKERLDNYMFFGYIFYLVVTQYVVVVVYVAWYLWIAASVNHTIKHQKRQLILLKNVYTEILIDIDTYFGKNSVLPQRHDFKFYVNYLKIMFKENKDDKDDHKEEIQKRLEELIERCTY